MGTTQIMIADLAERVQKAKGWERGFICARDCLLTWNNHGDGEILTKTVQAWDSYLSETDSHTDTERYGAWVPAIPL